MIREVLKRPDAKIFFSFVIGFGLAVLLFHRSRHEYDVLAMAVDELVNSVSKIDGKCYRFRITDASTPSV
jgi:hypothetical protein